jgi:hypothetical protein
VIADNRVDVLAAQRAFVFEDRVVVHDAANPVPRRRSRRLSLERLFDVFDSRQVDVDADRFLGKQRMDRKKKWIYC